MSLDESKMVLSQAQAAKLREVHAAVVDEFLDPAKRPANVLGLAAGTKWTDGQPTGKPALLVLVDQKIAKEDLPKTELVPARLKETQTDVLAIGQPFAGQMRQADGAAVVEAPVAPGVLERISEIEAGAQILAKRLRPAQGGYSIGHVMTTAGTLSTCVYDVGVTMPPRYYILSNNHVLANSNAAVVSDPILQPGPVDGGTDPADRIARLSRFIPITFEPPTPRAQHRNVVDAAVAEGQFHDLDREIYWIGFARGWRRKANVTVGTLVHKTGRTTSYTLGRIAAINATVDVQYGGGRVARFLDQIITTPMSAGGDSGSLVLTRDNVAVGLLFAGSPQATILNQIENVRTLLRVDVADQIL
jgi:hypothetical protein